MSCQIRCALWDLISREAELPALNKLILLTIANYTEPYRSKTPVPISLIVRDTRIPETDLRKFFTSLERGHWIEKTLVPNDEGRPPITVYHLAPRLLRAAQRQTDQPHP
ncbi:hypothetical protein [Leptolyngbya sp. FACHB-261]|uniref:hypothetical protein n=1 Tax=Leptolyngbya sp. FACHB-261 TaxID=2692806 RepID=UPI001686F809|nr:hypothetical protein [Leptolyngbya sp. FACHB-261]MBD2101963.1 hypothetical protein [Leptolyngbya sp. FACHB-261]